MVNISIWPVAILFVFTFTVQSQAQTNAEQAKNKSTEPSSGEIVAEEVIVESSLSVRPKPHTPSRRISRNTVLYLFPDQNEHIEPLKRTKRQYNSRLNNINQDTSQATAQSASYAHENGPFGSQSGDALAGAQAFQTNDFGATSNNAASLNQAVSPFGSQGGAAFSGGQTYMLPNGLQLNFNYNNGFNEPSNGPASTHQGSGIAING